MDKQIGGINFTRKGSSWGMFTCIMRVVTMKKILEKLRREEAQRTFYSRVRDDHVLDKGFVPKLIEPNKSYFQIRLSEMFLRNRREWSRKFVPLGIVVSDFIYDGQKQRFPFFVSSGLLKEIENYVERESVEYLDTRVAGPSPYLGGDVGIFVGLYRATVTDLAETLFNVLEGIVGTFDVTKLSQYFDIAGALSEALSILLNMKEVERRIAKVNVFSDVPGSQNQFQESYLAYVNCKEDVIAVDNLWVRDGRLYMGGDRKSIKQLQEYDYCLVHVQGHEMRSDYTALSFHQTWRNTRERIYSNDHIMATAMLIECCRQVASSPDLTREQAYNLQLTYKANFEKEVEIYNKIHGFASQRTATVSRGATGLLSPRAAIQQTVSFAEKTDVPRDVLDGLLDVSDNWTRIPYLEERTAELELTDAILSDQLQAIKNFSKVANPDPKALADAIAVAALSAD